MTAWTFFCGSCLSWGLRGGDVTELEEKALSACRAIRPPERVAEISESRDSWAWFGEGSEELFWWRGLLVISPLNSLIFLPWRLKCVLKKKKSRQWWIKQGGNKDQHQLPNCFATNILSLLPFSTFIIPKPKSVIPFVLAGGEIWDWMRFIIDLERWAFWVHYRISRSDLYLRKLASEPNQSLAPHSNTNGDSGHLSGLNR